MGNYSKIKIRVNGESKVEDSIGAYLYFFTRHYFLFFIEEVPLYFRFGVENFQFFEGMIFLHSNRCQVLYFLVEKFVIKDANQGQKHGKYDFLDMDLKVITKTQAGKFFFQSIDIIFQVIIDLIL